MPGLTYSYVFEASDRAGNRRNVVGKGFGVSAFAFDTPQGPVLTFSGRLLAPTGPAPARSPLPRSCWRRPACLNQAPAVRGPLRVTATARTREQAAISPARVARELGALTLGDPAHLLAVDQVEPDAPADGIIRIAAAAAR